MTTTQFTPVQALSPVHAAPSLSHPNPLLTAPERKMGASWGAAAAGASDSPFSRMLEQTRKAWRSEAPNTGQRETAKAPVQHAAAPSAPSAPSIASAPRATNAASTAAAPETARENQAPPQPEAAAQPQPAQAAQQPAQPGETPTQAAAIARRKARSAAPATDGQRAGLAEPQSPARKTALGGLQPGAQFKSLTDGENTLTPAALAESESFDAAGRAQGLAGAGSSSLEAAGSVPGLVVPSAAPSAASLTSEMTAAALLAQAASASTAALRPPAGQDFPSAVAPARPAGRTEAVGAPGTLTPPEPSASFGPVPGSLNPNPNPYTKPLISFPSPGGPPPSPAEQPPLEGGACQIEHRLQLPRQLAGGDGLQAAIDRAMASAGAAQRPPLAAGIDPIRETRGIPDSGKADGKLLPGARGQAGESAASSSPAAGSLALGANALAQGWAAGREQRDSAQAPSNAAAAAADASATATADVRGPGAGARARPGVNGAAAEAPAMAAAAEATTKPSPLTASQPSQAKLGQALSTAAQPATAESNSNLQSGALLGLNTPLATASAAALREAGPAEAESRAQNRRLGLQAADKLLLASPSGLALAQAAAAAALPSPAQATALAATASAGPVAAAIREPLRDARWQPGAAEVSATRLGAALPSAASLPPEAGRVEARPVFNAVLRSMREVAERTEALSERGTGRVGLEAAGSAAAQASPAFALDASQMRPELGAEAASASNRLNATQAAQAAQSMPAEASLLARPGQADFAPELGAQLTLWVRDGVHEARLHLNPAELGPVEVSIALDGAAAQVSFSAQSAETRQALEAALPALASNLRDAGMTLSGGGVFDQSQRPRDDSNNSTRDFGRQRSLASPGEGVDAARSNRLPPLQPRARGVVDLVA